MRISWITAAAILVSAQASAGLEQGLATCSAKADKLDRLICYDTLAESVKSAPKVISTQANTAAATTAVAATSVTAASQTKTIATPTTLPANIEDEFGNANLKKDEANKEINKIYLEIASISKDAYGALKVSFSNGQIWKQSDNRHFKVKVGETVFIEKAALGSFILGTDKRNSTIRVKRLK